MAIIQAHNLCAVDRLLARLGKAPVIGFIGHFVASDVFFKKPFYGQVISGLTGTNQFFAERFQRLPADTVFTGLQDFGCLVPVMLSPITNSSVSFSPGLNPM